MLALGIPMGPELIVILVVVVLIFGVGKLSDVGGALGKSIREFRKEAKLPDDEPDQLSTDDQAAAPPPAPAQSASARTCTSCQAQLAPNAKFCGECGATTQATVQ